MSFRHNGLPVTSKQTNKHYKDIALGFYVKKKIVGFVFQVSLIFKTRCRQDDIDYVLLYFYLENGGIKVALLFPIELNSQIQLRDSCMVGKHCQVRYIPGS